MRHPAWPPRRTRTEHGDGATQSITVDGVTWTYVYVGSIVGRYSTSDGTLRLLDLSEHATVTELKDGMYYSRKNYSGETSEEMPYTCSAQTLQLSAPGGFTDLLTRKS